MLKLRSGGVIVHFFPSTFPLVAMLLRLTVRTRLPARQLARAISTDSTREAYLESLGSGITALSLNRPASKNAISVRLLKVRDYEHMAV
jgi:hypothetical protein